MGNNKDKLVNFSNEIHKIILELTEKKKPYKCIFELYIDNQGEINKNPTIIIQSKSEI